MNGNTQNGTRQLTSKNIKPVLKGYELATMRAVTHIEQLGTSPDSIENCEEWIDIVETLKDAALKSQDALNSAKIAMFQAEPRFAKVYAEYSPIETASPDQVAAPDDRRLVILESGKTAFKVSKASDLRLARRAHWAIAGILQERTVSLVYGDAGVGKTFITLDLALHIALGLDWKGRAVRAAMNILYIYGEGDAGLRDRVGAWQQHYEYSDQALDKAYFLPFPVQAARESAQLCATIEQIGNVGLVVFDTFSMCASGVNENDNTSVAEWMNAAHYLKNTYGCMVIIVHHIGKSGDYRGASSFKGNIDSMICASVGEDGTTIQVESKKQRDHEAFKTFYLERRTISLGMDEETLEEITSCVVLAMEDRAVWKAKIDKQQLCLLEIIAATPGIGTNKLKAAAKDQGVTRTDYERRYKEIIDAGFISFEKSGQSVLSTLTEKGQQVLFDAAIDGEV